MQSEMTLRDHFAAAALTGLLARRDCYDHEVAVLAWDMADAMLRERERKNHDAAPERGDALAYDEAAARLLYERDSANDELSLLRRAVRQLLDGVNERHPEKPPREWVCNDMALLDRLVPPNHDASPEAIAGTPGTGDTQSFDAYAMFAGSVMNWISEATSAADWSSDGGRKIMAQACSRCWDAFDRIAYPTDHGASPEARAESDEDRTDKAATSHRRDGTGDTPVTKPMPQEKQAEVSDRSKPITGPDPDSRVWETPVHTPAPHATPGEGSVPREGTQEPVAWEVFLPGVGTYDIHSFRWEAAAIAHGLLANDGTIAAVCPLYRHPPCQDFSQKNLTLTDAEREALSWARNAMLVGVAVLPDDQTHNSKQHAATLGALLERTE